MDIEKLILKLHPFERTVLPVLQEEHDFYKIVKKSKLQEIEVMRALQWLENKELLNISSTIKKVISLDKNGVLYLKEGLPEKSFLNTLSDEFKGLNVITKKSKLNREEVNACIGLLRKKNAIEVQKGEYLQIRITEVGKRILKEKSPEELFLERDFPLELSQLQGSDKALFEELKRRKEFLKLEEIKETTVSLTDLGKRIASIDLQEEVINRLTTGMLKKGDWKQMKFRAYDVEINVPQKFAGKKHFENEALEYIKSIWLEMGFKEMTGNYVQSTFWDLDALFVPQDHPAREMQDTFYLHGKAKLPPIWKKIKEVHENGGDTGSKGWGYTFSKEETEQVLLRTHTTVLSAQTIAQLKKED